MAAPTTVSFALQFPASEIAHWAIKFREDEEEMDREAAASKAGRRLARRLGTRDDLEAIGLWKSPRTVPLLLKNKDAEITEPCRIAAQTSSDGCAIAVLQCLQGVGIPMASAILTVVNPQRYTVIDWRALEALGQPRKQPTIRDYVCYLAACRRLAHTHNVSFRKLDQALWAWSKYSTKSN